MWGPADWNISIRGRLSCETGCPLTGVVGVVERSDSKGGYGNAATSLVLPAGGQDMVWKVSNRFTHLLTTTDLLSSRWLTLADGERMWNNIMPNLKSHVIWFVMISLYGILLGCGSLRISHWTPLVPTKVCPPHNTHYVAHVCQAHDVNEALVRCGRANLGIAPSDQACLQPCACIWKTAMLSSNTPLLLGQDMLNGGVITSSPPQM